MSWDFGMTGIREALKMLKKEEKKVVQISRVKKKKTKLKW